MDDTRETKVANLHLPMAAADNENGNDIAATDRPEPRFKTGDVLMSAYRDGYPFRLRDSPCWDREFGGWLVAPGAIGVHESNFILASERGDWEPHPDGLWSWWTRR